MFFVAILKFLSLKIMCTHVRQNFWKVSSNSKHHSKPTMNINCNIIIYLETKFRPNRRIFVFGCHFVPWLPWQRPPFWIFFKPQKLSHTTVDIPTKWIIIWLPNHGYQFPTSKFRPNRRIFVFWRPFWIKNGRHSKPMMNINSQHHNLLGSQISPKSEDFCIWRPFDTLVTMATSTILNFINSPKANTHYGGYSYKFSWSLMKGIQKKM